MRREASREDDSIKLHPKGSRIINHLVRLIIRLQFGFANLHEEGKRGAKPESCPGIELPTCCVTYGLCSPLCVCVATAARVNICGAKSCCVGQHLGLI